MEDSNVQLSKLLDRLNPGLKMKDKWTYIPVQHLPEMDENFVWLHELFFNEDGGFAGITENPVNIIGDNKEDLLDGLQMAMADVKTLPVLTWEEHQLIFNAVD